MMRFPELRELLQQHIEEILEHAAAAHDAGGDISQRLQISYVVKYDAASATPTQRTLLIAFAHDALEPAVPYSGLSSHAPRR